MGLRYCTDFISPEEEAEVLQVLDGPGTELDRSCLVFTEGKLSFPPFFPQGKKGSRVTHVPISILSFPDAFEHGTSFNLLQSG